MKKIRKRAAVGILAAGAAGALVLTAYGATGASTTLHESTTAPEALTTVQGSSSATPEAPMPTVGSSCTATLSTTPKCWAMQDGTASSLPFSVHATGQDHLYSVKYTIENRIDHLTAYGEVRVDTSAPLSLRQGDVLSILDGYGTLTVEAVGAPAEIANDDGHRVAAVPLAPPQPTVGAECSHTDNTLWTPCWGLNARPRPELAFSVTPIGKSGDVLKYAIYNGVDHLEAEDSLRTGDSKALTLRPGDTFYIQWDSPTGTFRVEGSSRPTLSDTLLEAFTSGLSQGQADDLGSAKPLVTQRRIAQSAKAPTRRVASSSRWA